MVCALPSAARRAVYAKIALSGDDDAQIAASNVLTERWNRLGTHDFDPSPHSDAAAGESYATAIEFSTRADIREAVVALLEARGVSSPAPKQPKKRA